MLGLINFDQIIWVDAVVIAALVLSFGFGIVRGIVREVLSLSSWIVSIWLAYLYGDNLAIMIVPWIESERLSGLIGYVLVFVAVLGHWPLIQLKAEVQKISIRQKFL